MKRILMFIILCATAGLSACGQTGPLYLPGHEPPTHRQGNDNKQDISHKIDDALVSEQ